MTWKWLGKLESCSSYFVKNSLLPESWCFKSGYFYKRCFEESLHVLSKDILHASSEAMDFSSQIELFSCKRDQVDINSKILLWLSKHYFLIPVVWKKQFCFEYTSKQTRRHWVSHMLKLYKCQRSSDSWPIKMWESPSSAIQSPIQLNTSLPKVSPYDSVWIYTTTKNTSCVVKRLPGWVIWLAKWWSNDFSPKTSTDAPHRSGSLDLCHPEDIQGQTFCPQKNVGISEELAHGSFNDNGVQYIIMIQYDTCLIHLKTMILSGKAWSQISFRINSKKISL